MNTYFNIVNIKKKNNLPPTGLYLKRKGKSNFLFEVGSMLHLSLLIKFKLKYFLKKKNKIEKVKVGIPKQSGRNVDLITKLK